MKAFFVHIGVFRPILALLAVAALSAPASGQVTGDAPAETQSSQLTVPHSVGPDSTAEDPAVQVLSNDDAGAGALLLGDPMSDPAEPATQPGSRTTAPPDAASIGVEELPEHPEVDVDTLEDGDFPRFSPEEYLYAGGPRHTLMGKPPYRETHLKVVPALITTGVVGSIIAGIHIYQQDAWWADRRTGFHYAIDWGYAAQADKFGHFFAGYFCSYVGYESLVASGFRPKIAALVGPALAMGFQTYVEIEDGFSPFGFDPTDQVPNMLGPILFSAQHFVPALQNLKFKWGYYPPAEPEDPEVYSGHNTIVIDDYNGQTIWLSLKLGNILPKEWGWPRWLRLAAGYGAEGVDHWRRTENGGEVLLEPGRRAYISLDYDLLELVPDIGTFGNWIIQTLDYIHLPAPALQIAPEVKFHILFPVRF